MNYIKFMGNIENLSVWKNAIQLAKSIYTLTNSNNNLSKDFGLKDQIQRSAVSIASNIAEGNDRSSDKEFARFLYIAKGSTIELLTQIIIAFEISYISEEELHTLREQITIIHKQLTGLIKHLQTSGDI